MPRLGLAEGGGQADQVSALFPEPLGERRCLCDEVQYVDLVLVWLPAELSRSPSGIT